jgi:chromosome segregation ATPase
MSDLTAAIKGVREFSRLINTTLFKNVALLDGALEKVASIESEVSGAHQRKAQAEQEAKAIQEKLNVLQNTLESAEKAVAQKQADIDKVVASAKSRLDSVENEARKNADKITAEAQAKVAKLATDSRAGAKLLQDLQAEIATKEQTIKALDHKIGELRAQAGGIARG